MNTAFLSFERAAAFGYADKQTDDQARRFLLVDDSYLFEQVSAFCTRVLLLGGRSPVKQPTLSRILLASYAGGALVALADDAGLDAEARGELIIRVLREALNMTAAEAEQHAALLVSEAAAVNPRLREIMQRGATAFAEWQADPAEFVPADFRQLIAAVAAR